jgi:outer membrane murein-binding lipoprotein Lpp
MQNLKAADWLWKLFTVVLGVLIMPLAGWVWSVNVEVAQLRNDVGDLENQVAQLEKEVEQNEEATRTLIGVEKDVQHIREILDRIEELVTR